MTSRIRIFDHYCKPLVELSNIPTTPRSWVLNGYGKCEFSIGFNPSKKQAEQLLQERYFQYGNLIHITHLPANNGGQLPDWTGIILPPRNWDLGVCHITAFGIEALLSFRAMPYVTVDGTPKAVFEEIIRRAHEIANNIIFQPGTIDDLPVSSPDDLSMNAYDHINKIIKNASMDWSVTGQIGARGNLELYANLYQRKGYDTPLVLNNQNTELQGSLMGEQGTLTNQVFGYSQAQTKRQRVMAMAINQGAYDDYGPLQINQVYMGKHGLAAVQSASQTKADLSGRPRKVFRRTVLNVNDTFDYLDIGNTVTIRDTNVGFHPNGGYGFEAKCRILSMDYNDMSDRVPVNFEVLE